LGVSPVCSGDQIDVDGESLGICKVNCRSGTHSRLTVSVRKEVDERVFGWNAKELVVVDDVLQTVSTGELPILDPMDGGDHGCPGRSVQEEKMSETMLCWSMFDVPSISVKQT
jgi:hypothetical protein